MADIPIYQKDVRESPNLILMSDFQTARVLAGLDPTHIAEGVLDTKGSLIVDQGAGDNLDGPRGIQDRRVRLAGSCGGTDGGIAVRLRRLVAGGVSCPRRRPTYSVEGRCRIGGNGVS